MRVPSVGVIFGGPSPEHDISILTGLQAYRVLSDAGWSASALYWSKSSEWFRLEGTLEAPDFLQGPPAKAEAVSLRVGGESGVFPARDSRFSKGRPYDYDVLVNCCHGGPGEDGTLQALLDQLGVPYTGPSQRSAALGMDKLAFAGVMSLAGVPLLPRVLLDHDLAEIPFDGPYIVKPRFGGSSIGIEVVSDLATAKLRLNGNVHLRAGAIVEPYRADLFDLQLAVRTFPHLRLSQIERPLRGASGAEILSYGDKYIAGEGMATAPRELPARLAEEMSSAIMRFGEVVARAAGVRGVARIDFLASEDGELYVNEVNTIPGSLSHYLWVEPKWSFVDQLLNDIEEAKSRPAVTTLSAGADGTVLRSASQVAAKLA
jgi:D-alanine-D-alanine ligase